MIGNNGIIFLCNVAESIIFIWINNPYNNMYNFGETVKTLYNGKRSSYIIFQRSLARHVAQKEFNRSNIRNKLLENNSHNNVKCTSDDLTKYSQLKKKELNDLDLYKKLYKHRYSKKNILGKLDCYCEKKIFDKYDQIHDLAEKLQNDKKTFKKKVNKIFGIRLILFGLIPVLELIIPLLSNEYFSIVKGCFSDCTNSEHLDNSKSEPKPHKAKYNVLPISESTWDTICTVDLVFLCVSTVIVSCVVLYIFIKVIKYKKLKAGRDKMSLKEYYYFTKSLI
ncbi:hypothetical protein PVBG_04839 [Plasmodium vivax Brazil I]|uniref:Variable surface protein n=1 Tax=Plasmodium vivax (strain Brazil I) TaxID=1033975 RepID=A0A0J9T0S9_PLAV1|nr:hypothetical protein PVBG_04839 [Plasmodium vivax Brazil I]